VGINHDLTEDSNSRGLWLEKKEQKKIAFLEANTVTVWGNFY
jgi:hypothetical protein